MAIDNPGKNKLAPSMKEQAVLDAIQKSGYPLQTFVASELSAAKFGLQEEWCYLDKEMSKLRTVDILGEMKFYSDDHPRVRPHLALIVECKQSDLPYVFFRSLGKTWPTEFPFLTGLHKYEIQVLPRDSRDTYFLNALAAMRLTADAFIAEPPESCTVFSKLQRKGNNIEIAELKPNEIELSGSRAYTSLVLPLIKSMQHHRQAERPPDAAQYFDFSMVIGLGVIDGPMFTFVVEAGVPKLIPSPWVRVFRHEYAEDKHRFARHRVYGIDLVHKEFFSPYLNEHVLPFYERFKACALGLHEVIATGRAWTDTHVNVFTDGQLSPQ